MRVFTTKGRTKKTKKISVFSVVSLVTKHLQHLGPQGVEKVVAEENDVALDDFGRENHEKPDRNLREPEVVVDVSLRGEVRAGL